MTDLVICNLRTKQLFDPICALIETFKIYVSRFTNKQKYSLFKIDFS